MTEGKVHNAFARIGDALVSASMCETTASALETLLRDVAPLLHRTRLVVVRGDEQLAAAGVDDDELREEMRRVIASGALRGSTRGWLVARHTVAGRNSLCLLTARPRDAPTHDDALVSVLTGALALAVGIGPPGAPETQAVALPDVATVRRTKLLEVLLGIQRRISHRAPLLDVLEAAVRGASLLLGNDAAVIVLVDPSDPDLMEPVAWANVDEAWFPAFRRMPVTADVSGRAIQEQRLVVSENFLGPGPTKRAVDRLRRPRSDAAARDEIAFDVGVAAAMAAPVSTAGRVMGAIWVGTADIHRRYSAEDRTMLLALAENVSLALTDAHNLQRVDEALHDAVTGLPTRTLFLDRLNAALDGRTSNLAVLFCDLDRFKRVNDSLGHAAGDELLFQVAGRLPSVLRPSDTAARLGGDEFSALLVDVDEPSAEAIASRIVAAFDGPFTVRGHSIRIGISIGLATAVAGQAADGEHLLGAADMAMYRAKRAGGSRVRRFEPFMAAKAVAQLALETDLQRALPAGELHLVFQPIFDLWADRVAGLETLLRWTNPRRGPVPPDAFIPLAEESGLIKEIDTWVINNACTTMRAWQRTSGRDDVDLGVNLSTRQLHDPGLVWTIERALDASGIHPARFVVEVTEHVVLADVETAIDRLRQIRALGVRVALDDFGTGYSSLNYLRRLPIDFLKIDGAFLPDVNDERAWALTTTLVRMASDMGMVAIAEGIETEQQLSRLLKMGCPDGQGYFLARPVPGDELASAVDRHLPTTHTAPTATSLG